MPSNSEMLSDVDLNICTALLMKEWRIRYKGVFKIDFEFRDGDEQKIKDMVKNWGYDRTFITIVGAIQYYPELFRTEQFKWLTVNQVYTWIGKRIWRMYIAKQFKVRNINRPKI